VKRSHLKGLLGPGGPRCSCCGGSMSHRERGRFLNSARRRADRAETMAQVQEMHDAGLRLDSIWFDLQWRIFCGEHHEPELRAEMDAAWADAEADAAFLSSSLDYPNLDALIEHVADHTAHFGEPDEPEEDLPVHLPGALYFIDCNGPGRVFRCFSEEALSDAREGLILQGGSPCVVSQQRALRYCIVGIDREGPWTLQDAPAMWLEEGGAARKTVEST
jgi:hypothetical protein